MSRLNVNIDHIATIRQARRTNEPNPVSAAVICELAGADGITTHLRSDRRHIQDYDLIALKQAVITHLNVEMAATDEMVEIASRVKPDVVTLVPETPQEITTEGGLDVVAHKKTIKKAISKLKDSGIFVSLFIDPDEEQIKAAAQTGAPFIEIHTGEYARKPNQANLKKVIAAVKYAKKLGLRVNAGHGLDYNNVGPVARIKEIEELNIGFAIIARSVFVGLKKATQEMRREMK